MEAIHATKRVRAVGVLLGGSGRALVAAVRQPTPAALFTPPATKVARAGVWVELRAA